MIKAEVILASASAFAKPLYTVKLRYPWFIHGELMTHRVFSRNASSNRAVPLKKMLEEARSDELRAEPVFWGAEQKGMEPGGELSDLREFGRAGVLGPFSKRDDAKMAWKDAALAAAAQAERLGKLGLHKSLCNRLLMPFTHANVVVTSTEWDNFFGLRLDKSADPTMRALAEALYINMKNFPAKVLQPGQWHLPFIPWETWQDHYCMEGGPTIDTLIKVSVARCARVSYETFPTTLEDGTVVPGKRSTVEEDLKLYNRLVGAQPLHASPAEHQATPDTPRNPHEFRYGWQIVWQNPEQHGNLVGWRQHRKMLAGEAVAPLPEEYRR